MKKAWKLAVIVLAAAVVLTAAAYCVLRFGFSIDLLDRSGWNDETGQNRYLDYYGRPLTGWHQLDGDWYYFDLTQGNMATGWQTLSGKDYYFGTDGRMVRKMAKAFANKMKIIRLSAIVQQQCQAHGQHGRCSRYRCNRVPQHVLIVIRIVLPYALGSR